MIQVEGIGKRYRLGQSIRHDTLRDAIMHRVWARKGVSEATEGRADDHFWALRDISFDVAEGEVVGIIGRNGAGKSTLLKILSRITPPTEGRIRLHGRVASLLEVGTGFHPELSGRENIYMNGAILGMRRREITAKFDAIVAFAEVEKFLDTPVKRYSSGMYVRLAFAVAAHLEPQILVVDEVLAVGDAEFQKKALGKMSRVVEQGRTVLFVSHNMAAVTRLCQRAILLREGRIECDGGAAEVVNAYLKSNQSGASQRSWGKRDEAPGDDVVRLREVRVHDSAGSVSNTFDVTEPIGVTMQYEVLEDGPVFTHGFNLHNEQGLNVFSSHDVVSPIRRESRNRGTYTATVWIPGNLLAEGVFFAGVALLRQEPLLIHMNDADSVSFTVVDRIDGSSARGEFVGGFPGVVRPLLQWETKKGALEHD
jgi:lipopolysaccharide transport system ATP-binding protein